MKSLAILTALVALMLMLAQTAAAGNVGEYHAFW